MSLREPTSAPEPSELPVAQDFQERFIRDAHQLIAEGFARLDPAELPTKSEEAISGRIDDRCNDWLNHQTAPSWTKSYFVTSERPERSGKREGKKRPRVDIFVESSSMRPRARFVFEAKRLYRSNSVAEYVGASGLGDFLDGSYQPSAPAAGMLGFVQKGSTDGWIEKVRQKLDRERRSHGLTEQGPIWGLRSLDERLGTTYLSRHARAAPLARLEIYHSFLLCCDS